MEGTAIEVALLQPGEKVVGSAYLTQDGEIVFSPHADAIDSSPLVARSAGTEACIMALASARACFPEAAQAQKRQTSA